MKSSDKMTSDLMKRIRSMTNAEYQIWLDTARDIVRKMPKASDLYFLDKLQKERRIDAHFKKIHSDGLEKWREAGRR